MKKLNSSALLQRLAKRALNPLHATRAARRHRHRKPLVRNQDDPQLKLYSQLVPDGFLHYGYFDDPTICPRDMSLNSIAFAQARYAELVLDMVSDSDSEILDVGCGMGGLVRLMLERDLKPVALSPDKHQIHEVQAHYPQTPTIQTRFEDIDESEHRARYGTVINAESLNYLHLEDALPRIEQILKPEGRWIICDFFRLDEKGGTSGHWEHFQKSVEAAGFFFSYQRDITPHVLPTLAYIHMWGEQIALPVIDFSVEKMRAKQPGLHYLLEESLDTLLGQARNHLQFVSPDEFRTRKKYMLLVAERRI